MQRHINTKMILGILIASAFLLGSMVTPVAALQTNMVEEIFNYTYAPGANNHTYIYSPANDPSFLPSASYMHYNEDIDLTYYYYMNNGWSSFGSSGIEDTTELWGWTGFNTFSGGTYGNPSYLPNFYDFVGSDGSGAVVNTTIERRSFSLAFGQQTPVAVDSDFAYYGTLAISGQEFVHLTIASLQDGFSWTIIVSDPEGRQMAQTTGSGGDIVVLPFRPSIAGTYIVEVHSNAFNGERALFQFLPTAVSPQLIVPGEVITGTLPTGEIVILDETGSLTHDELVPTVKTYKVNPGTDVSSLSYSFNYPTPGDWGWTQGVSITFTSDAFTYGYNGGNRYRTSISYPDNDEYRFRDGVHYVTVMGGDNIDYTLYHEADVATELIVNQEFRIDNLFGHTETEVYSLTLTEDSVLKCNSTPTADFETTAFATFDDGYRFSYVIEDGSDLITAQYYYLPAGDYIFEVDVGMDSSEWIEFSTGPLITETSADIVNVGGFIVPTDPGHQYNFTITLDNLYNVSVPMQIVIWDQFYNVQWSQNPTLGTWFNGSSQIPHTTDESTLEYTLGSRVWSEDYAIITMAIYPYNNTAGIGDYFEDFAVNLTIDWEDVTHYYFEDTAIVDATTSSASHEFDFSDYTFAIESYALLVNTTPGTWYNVSISTINVDDLDQVTSFAPYNARTHFTNWGDLSDALQGAAPDWSIQFGAISDYIYLEFQIDRDNDDTGSFEIEIIPFDTHQLEHPNPLAPQGPDILAMLGGIALPLGIGVVIIVVVVVVYVKKFKN
ncbi:MAG: hypothetical protein RTV72_06395 [Candidatus Thorarchaeota archaeon]